GVGARRHPVPDGVARIDRPGELENAAPDAPEHTSAPLLPTSLSPPILGRPRGRAQGAGNALLPGEMLLSGTSDNPMPAACPHPRAGPSATRPRTARGRRLAPTREGGRRPR